jgi:hypothetical protein
MPTLPKSLETEVVRRLYEDAQRLDWLHLSMMGRQRQYNRWVEDPHVGGVLVRFISQGLARVWIKDGPMKEFARASAGVGRFARLVKNSGRTADEIIAISLGKDWTVRSKSVGIKPLHCVAESTAGRVFVCWGPPKDFKHLLWAAIRAADLKGQKARLVIIERLGQEVLADQRKQFVRLTDRCGVEFDTMRLG